MNTEIFISIQIETERMEKVGGIETEILFARQSPSFSKSGDTAG
jgi:hypothetical protein